MRRHLTSWRVGALFFALAIVHTWPLASDLTHLSRIDNADTQLNAWIVSWVAHQLPRDPSDLFAANIFHPAPRALAYSEPLLVPALVGAPWRWLGASPITTYNVLVLVGLVTSALAMYALVMRFTNDPAAAVLAGSLFAFNSHTLTRFPHLQAFHVQWLPLSLWALDRLVIGGRRRDAAWLALFFSLAALTSGHLAVFVTVALTTALVVRPDRWWGRRGLTIARRLGGAALAAAVVIVLVLWPYAVVNEGGPIHRSLSVPATLDQYLATGGRLHYGLWSHRFYVAGADALFPGLTAVVLAGVALVSRRTDRARMAMFGGIAIVGGVLSLGPATPFYDWLLWAFPPAHAIRATSRFGYLLLFGVAGLAGLGLFVLRPWFRRKGCATVAAICCVAFVNLEALRAPLAYVPFSGFSPIYTTIAEDPEARVVVEFPFFSGFRIDRNADYVLASTVHWRPLLNGFSGFTPLSYAEVARRLRGFPRPRAVRYLEDLGVTHLVVHPWRYEPGEAAQLLRRMNGRRALQLLQVDARGSRLYRLR